MPIFRSQTLYRLSYSSFWLHCFHSQLELQRNLSLLVHLCISSKKKRPKQFYYALLISIFESLLYVWTSIYLNIYIYIKNALLVPRLKNDAFYYLILALPAKFPTNFSQSRFRQTFELTQEQKTYGADELRLLSTKIRAEASVGRASPTTLLIIESYLHRQIQIY